MKPDLLLTNARVLTLNPDQPMAGAVAVKGETIMAVGSLPELQTALGQPAREIDCQGLTLMPGFVDAHCHLLALAASLSGVDCGPKTVRCIRDLKRVIGKQAQKTPAGQWIRGYGYDELSTSEARHPTRGELDEVTSEHPVRINHRSGHAVVLNSLALELAGIQRDTPDPVDGVIERDQQTGEPTGVLFEMAGFLRERIGAERERAEQSIRLLDRKLLECGITSVQDAGANNDLARWAVFQELVGSGKVSSRATMMPGARYLDEFTDAGMGWGYGDQRLRLGHAKIMLTLTTGDLYPSLPELENLVLQCHQAGFPVAIHAVETEAATAAAEVISDQRAWPNGQSPASTDRIEHCSECPDDVLALVIASGAIVVTQPGFIYWRGDQYLKSVSPELIPHLYPVHTLIRSGVKVAFSSDAPVVDPNPWPGIYAAVTRRTRDGSFMHHDGSANLNSGVPVLDALRMYTLSGACAEGKGFIKGKIQPGMLADLVLIDTDPTIAGPSALKDVKTVLTMVGGKVVWERSS